MFTEEQLRAHLENISPNTEFMQFEFSNTEKFIIKIRCDIDKNKPMDFYSTSIDRWVKSFSKFTATIWTARTSYIKKKTLLLQKNFKCQPVSYGKNKKQNRNIDCKAQIEFKVKLINGNTDLNLFISIDFDHSHNVYLTPSSSLTEGMSETDKLFFEYFDNGFNATTSKTYHELTLILRYDITCAQYLADEEVNPSIEHIQFLINKMQSKEIQRSFRDSMEAKKAFIKDSGGKLMYSEEPEIVAIITPLMKKILLNNRLDCVLVDSSPVKVGLVVTFFYISNKTGALPIACVLHTAETVSNFKEAFNILKNTIQIVQKNFYPEIFIVNDLVEQKIALSEYYPKTTLITSRWSICSEIWKWLCNDDLRLDHRRRHSIMFLFKTLIYANANNAHAHYTKLIVNDYFDSQTRLREYIDYLWGRSKEWLLKEEFKLYNLTEISIRLLREFMLRKCRFFNIIMMTDVVSKLLETHTKTIINMYIDGIPKTMHYTKFFYRSYSTRSNEEFVQIHSNEFMVQYQFSPNLYYHVKTDTACCDCAIGKQGRLCDHLGIIYNEGFAKALKIQLLTNIEVDQLIRFIGFNNKNYYAKCELLDKTGATEGATSVKLNTIYLNKYQRDCAEDSKNEIIKKLLIHHDVKSPKFYVLKKIKHKNDKKTIKRFPDIFDLLASKRLIDNKDYKGKSIHREMKHKNVKRSYSKMALYMKSLTKINGQFQKMMKNLQNNPTTSNMTTIESLSKVLSKIKSQIKADSDNTNADAGSKGKKKKPND